MLWAREFESIKSEKNKNWKQERTRQGGKMKPLVKDDDYREMSWVESVLYFHNGYSKNKPIDLLCDKQL